MNLNVRSFQKVTEIVRAIHVEDTAASCDTPDTYAVVKIVIYRETKETQKDSKSMLEDLSMKGTAFAHLIKALSCFDRTTFI